MVVIQQTGEGRELADLVVHLGEQDGLYEVFSDPREGAQYPLEGGNFGPFLGAIGGIGEVRPRPARIGGGWVGADSGRAARIESVAGGVEEQTPRRREDLGAVGSVGSVGAAHPNSTLDRQ